MTRNHPPLQELNGRPLNKIFLVAKTVRLVMNCLNEFAMRSHFKPWAEGSPKSFLYLLQSVSSEKVSRRPRRLIFCLPHSRTVSTIDLSIWMLISYWLWLEAKIMNGTVCSRLFKQPLNSDPAIIASLWYCSFSWLVKIPSFPVAFRKFVKGCNKDTWFCSCTVIFCEKQNTVLTVASFRWWTVN